jgi:succinyl-CoA synthetase beta subunit
VQFGLLTVFLLQEDLLYLIINFLNYTTGTNVDEAKKILSTSGLDIVSASDLEEAAQKAVACLKG